MTSEKYNQIDDISAAEKLVAAETLGGLNVFRKRHVGWIPFVAFWAIAYFFVQTSGSQGDGGSFRGAGLALLYMAGIFVYCLVFFIIAALQYGTFRKARSKSPRLAVIAMFLHGAVVAYFVFGLTMLLSGH